MSEVNIELLIKDILESSKKSQDKRLSFFNDILTKVKRGNRESLEALRVIERNYQSELLSEKDALNHLKAKVDALEKELVDNLNNFSKNFNIEKETQKLQDNKEKGMLPKTQIFRKETHDVTFKLDRLLKEEKDTLKLKQDEYDEMENSYKSKILDLEKRLRYEVNKVKSSTLEQYDELQKSLLNNNNRKEIKQINKRIEEIRKIGIKSEKEIRQKYIKEIEIVEIEFAKVKKDALIVLNNTKSEFNIKKQELETERKLVNLKYQVELDKYDFGSKRAINNLKQKMIAKKNAAIVNQYENIKTVSLEYKNNHDGKIDYKKSMSNDFINVFNTNYSAYGETAKLGAILVNNSYLDQINVFKEYLGKIIEYAMGLFVQLHDEYVNNVINNEYETLKIFINAKYNYDSLCRRDVSKELEELNALYNSFIEEIKNNSLVYNNKISDLFSSLQKSLDSLVESIKEVWNETNTISTYHSKIINQLNDFIKRNNEYLEKTYEEEHNGHAYVKQQIQKYDDSLNNSNNENNNMNEEHGSLEKQIDEELNAYYDEKEKEKASINEELKNTIENIKEDTKKLNDSYVFDMNQTLENIQIKKVNDLKEIENDYKTQMNLLK